MAKLSEKKVKVSDLIGLIPNHLYDSLSKFYQSDKWVKKLKSEVLFKLVLYSLLSTERISLRVMKRQAESSLFAVLARVSIDELAHTTIRARLQTIPSEYFRDIYTHVYEQLSASYSQRQLGKYHLKRYDSTMIAVFAHLIEGMKVGNSSKNKRQVKYTTELIDDGLIRVRYFADQAHLSEEKALSETIQSQTHKENEIVVFDRGIQSRKTFQGFDQQQIPFITRLSAKVRYKLISKAENLPQDSDSIHFVQDSIVYLYQDGHKVLEYPFRLIEIQRDENQEPIFFLTNILDLDADLIASIYKMRWAIEVLFKFLKQEMNLKHLISSDRNAIETMLYITLIAAMLVLIYKAQNSIKSYKDAKIRFFNELQAAILLDTLNTKGGDKWLKERVQYHVDYG
jgi:hypothetical protein